MADSQPDAIDLSLLFALGEDSRLADLVRLAAMGSDLSRALEALEAETPDFDIFRRRVLADERPTLRQLGEELGISAERVRQREKRAREAIGDQMQIENSPMQAAVNTLRARLGSLARLENFEKAMAMLDSSKHSPGSKSDRQALLLYLTGHEISGDWVQSVGLSRRTERVLEALTEEGPIDLEDCCREIARLGVEEEMTRPWIASRSGFQIVGEQVARESQATDIAVAILRASLEPLDLHELFALIEPQMSYESFRSHIQRDQRFMRLGVRRYGLSEWGGDPYTTLAEEMTEEIDRNGGAMSLEVLAKEMVERFDVAEGSVLHRARAPQFKVDSTGEISRRVAPRVTPPKPLALSHNCFHLEAGWAMKVKVTPDLLRGATVNMPLAFARSIGLQFGTSLSIACSTGALRAYWPRYAVSAAYLSSLRESAERLGAVTGDHLFVIHSGRGHLDFKLIEAKVCKQALGMSRLVLECGLDPGEEPASQALAALGLDPGLPNAIEVLRVRLGERHERRLIAWIDQAISDTGERMRVG